MPGKEVLRRPSVVEGTWCPLGPCTWVRDPTPPVWLLAGTNWVRLAAWVATAPLSRSLCQKLRDSPCLNPRLVLVRAGAPYEIVSRAAGIFMEPGLIVNLDRVQSPPGLLCNQVRGRCESTSPRLGDDLAMGCPAAAYGRHALPTPRQQKQHTSLHQRHGVPFGNGCYP